MNSRRFSNSHRIFLVFVWTVSVPLCSSLVRADVIILSAQKDNTLYESATGSLSNGAGEHFFAGRTNQGAGIDKRRGLIKFDIAASVPAGSTINSVTLTLRMSRTQAGNTPVSLRRVLADWGEGTSQAGGQEGAGGPATAGDATWIHTFYNTSFWGTPGGVYQGGAPSATITVGGSGFYNWSTTAMTTEVQSWLNNPASNFGWIVIGDESALQTSKRFDSRQNGIESRRPKLTVNYAPGATSGACCLAGGVCSVLTPSDCTAQAGAYQGNSTNCDPNPCMQPTGACCAGNGACSELSLGSCSSAGGSYQGDGSDCSPNPCPQPTGGCCFSGASCLELTANDCTTQAGVYNGDGSACDPNPCPLILEPFVDALPIPQALQPTSGELGGEAYYEIAMTEFEQQLHRDLPPTTVWGYAGSYPGPIVEASVSEPVTVRWINDLRDEFGNLRTEHYLAVDTCLDGPDTMGAAPRTVAHLHGAHVPMEFDGYPEATYLPGEYVDYVYPNLQLPANLWFHDHALGITRLNVYMGLAGLYLLRDSFEQSLNLPEGEFEIPLVMQDRAFNMDGTLHYPALWEEHYFGDFVLVNGKVWPYLDVKRGKYRFRLLNGSTSRTYTLALSNGATFHQIGTDGGLLPAPVPLTVVTLSPGERADVVMDFAPYSGATEIILTNSAPAPYPGEPGVGVVPNVMKFVVSSQGGDTTPLPSTLRPIEVLQETDAHEFRDFVLRKQPNECTGTMWMINDLMWDDITEYPELGTTEVWSFINRSGMVHPMHMHLVMFQVLDRQAFDVIGDEIVPVGPPVPPPPNEAGWKDTVRANPQEITRVIARFEDYTGKFAYHCHVLEHEDHEMMRQFQVVPPCPADLSGDGVINASDLALLLGAWGPNPGHPADLTDDGIVNASDLALLLGAWGGCPMS